MGTDAEVGGDFSLFFLFTSNPVSTPHVNTTVMTTSWDMAIPTTPGAFIFRTSDDVNDVSVVAMYYKQQGYMWQSQVENEH